MATTSLERERIEAVLAGRVTTCDDCGCEVYYDRPSRRRIAVGLSSVFVPKCPACWGSWGNIGHTAWANNVVRHQKWPAAAEARMWSREICDHFEKCFEDG